MDEQDFGGLPHGEAFGEDGGGDDAGVLALEGLELAAEGGDGDSRAVQAEHFFILRSFPVISGHLALHGWTGCTG